MAHISRLLQHRFRRLPWSGVARAYEIYTSAGGGVEMVRVESPSGRLAIGWRVHLDDELGISVYAVRIEGHPQAFEGSSWAGGEVEVSRVLTPAEGGRRVLISQASAFIGMAFDQTGAPRLFDNVQAQPRKILKRLVYSKHDTRRILIGRLD